MEERREIKMATALRCNAGGAEIKTKEVILTINPMNITETNRKIIQLMGDGNTDKEIADNLKMPIKTVHKKVHAMLKKHNCRNRTQLVLKVVLFNIGTFTGKT
jgi:DNA-binding NarL/FixJ family response regulator